MQLSRGNDARPIRNLCGTAVHIDRSTSIAATPAFAYVVRAVAPSTYVRPTKIGAGLLASRMGRSGR